MPQESRTSARMIEVTDETWQNGDYLISTDPARLNVPLIHDFISNHSYWGQGRKIETVQRALNNSLNFGLYKNDEQIGFARVVTDYCTFAWLADVFVVEDYRGTGLSKWLMEVIISHPQLVNMRRWVLATKDAHGLYAHFGFEPLSQPERWMEWFKEEV
ncbi:MAG TPA: GNAT family N-acetyltransferase [Pyrinomonadaceae bacterium]|nr:GNAT family N-acetyltransferase [Pyrinomonadaceae bacterium]